MRLWKVERVKKNIKLIRNTAQESSDAFLVLSIIYWIFFQY